MNRLLADAVVVLNKIAALLIIVFFLIGGYGTATGAGWPAVVGILLGGVVGVLVAGFFCGIVALLALIESHLRTLAKPPHAAPAPQPAARKPSADSAGAWGAKSDPVAK